MNREKGRMGWRLVLNIARLRNRTARLRPRGPRSARPVSGGRSRLHCAGSEQRSTGASPACMAAGPTRAAAGATQGVGISANSPAKMLHRVAVLGPLIPGLKPPPESSRLRVFTIPTGPLPNGTRLRFWTVISVGIARLLPPRSLPPWRSVHNQNAASVAPSPPCGLSAWSGVSKAFSREHRSTEASSVVAWRRRWVAFWWRTSLDGGKPRRGRKSPRGYLTSYHSAPCRWKYGLATNNTPIPQAHPFPPRRSTAGTGAGGRAARREGAGVRGAPGSSQT